MQKEFKRSLSKHGLQRVRDNANLVALLQYCRADPSLTIFLRGASLDVYWEGFVVFHVTVVSGKLRVGSESDKRSDGLPTSLESLDPARLPELIAGVKERRAEKAATRVPELRFEAAVIRDNQAVGSPVVVLDRQIARPGGVDQLDLMLLDVGTSRLALAELKVERSREVGDPVLKQLQRYVEAFSDLAKEYGEILKQMQELGLVANQHARIDPTQAPLPIVMLAGLPVKKLGAPQDSPRLHRLQKANEQMLDVVPGWQARMLVFPRRTDQSFSIPTSLEDLPKIETWCQRYLTG